MASRHRFIIKACLVIVLAVAALVTSTNVMADTHGGRGQNAAERDAYDRCGTEHQGAIWMSGSPTFSHNQSITISTVTSDKVDLYLYGSVYTCRTAKTGNRAVYACNITFNGTDRRYLPNWTRSDGKRLYRGTSTPTTRVFFEPNDDYAGLAVPVDVSMIAPGGSRTYSVGINRVYGWGGCSSSQVSGGYDTTNIQFTVRRQAGPTTYTVAYNANGGSGSMSGNPFTENQNATHAVRTNTFTRASYAFDRWCTNANGSGSCYNPGNTFAVTANVTLYAQWQPPAATNWSITSNTYSAVNPTNPSLPLVATNSPSTGEYSSTAKTAYPGATSFGGHAPSSDDSIYFVTQVKRSNDSTSGNATFNYRTTHIIGRSLTSNTTTPQGNTALSSSICTAIAAGYSYDSTNQRCVWAGLAQTNGAIPNNEYRYYQSQTSVPTRLLNDNPTLNLNNAKGYSICSVLNLGRISSTQTQTSGNYPYNSTANGCVTIGYPWILQPIATSSLPGGASLAVGDSYTVTPSIASSDTTVDGTLHTMTLVQVIGSATWTPVQGMNAIGSVNPVQGNIASFGSGAETISTIQTVNNLTDTHFNNGARTWTGTASNLIYADSFYGKKVCYYTVITSGGWAFDRTTEYRYSNPVCIKWTKSPQVQLRGSDASSGGIWDGTGASYDGGFITTPQVDASRGSWAQYGLLAYRGQTNSFGSAGYTTSDSANRAKACALTFANTIGGANCSSSATGGQLYNGSTLTQTINLPANAKLTTAQVNALTSAGSSPLTLNGLASGTYRVAAGARINASSIPSGRQITIISTGDIYLDGNIQPAAASFTSLTEVPMLTIVAQGQIIVGSSVDRLFGNYIVTSADGTKGFKTCDVNAVDTNMRDGGSCNRQLRVNGAVISRSSPMLRRTIGSGRSSADTTTVTANGETHLESITPAELFNYQPNTFLTPYTLRQSSTSSWTWVVTSQTILPARF